MTANTGRSVSVTWTTTNYSASWTASPPKAARVGTLAATLGAVTLSGTGVRVFNDNALRWILDDNLADTVVIGNEVDAVMVGGNTADVYGTMVDATKGLHLDGATQYVRIDVPKVWPSAVANLWTKYASNPVLQDSSNFGQLCKNPSGGWYFFAARGNNSVYRWESTDLIAWTNGTLVLAGGGAGAWDEGINVASVFQKPDDSWVMLYRGVKSGVYQIGLATSADGTTFVRKDNGGVNDGLFPQFGSNFDPVGIILVGTTYYVFVNGYPSHGASHIYYSVDDFSTFTLATTGPTFSSFGTLEYCATVFYYNGYYYALVPRDINAVGSVLYDHCMGVWRSTDVLFSYGSSNFLGYAVVNDTAYDAAVVDVPAVPMTDVFKTTYAPEFGDVLKMIYAGASTGANCLATTSLSGLSNLKPRPDEHYEAPHSINFKVQFDSLTAGDAVLSFGDSPSETSPRWLLRVQTSGANKVLSLFLGGENMSNVPLSIDTVYRITLVENNVNRKIYVNKTLAGTFTNNASVSSKRSKIYLGCGYNAAFLDGYVADFRIYPYELSSTEIGRLVDTDSVL